METNAALVELAGAVGVSAPTIAGKDVANPTSMILSVAMLIRWIGDKHSKPAMQKAGDAMTAAVDKVLEDPMLRTPDLGGTSGCKAFGEGVAKAIGSF